MSSRHEGKGAKDELIAKERDIRCDCSELERCQSTWAKMMLNIAYGRFKIRIWNEIKVGHWTSIIPWIARQWEMMKIKASGSQKAFNRLLIRSWALVHWGRSVVNLETKAIIAYSHLANLGYANRYSLSTSIMRFLNLKHTHLKCRYLRNKNPLENGWPVK